MTNSAKRWLGLLLLAFALAGCGSDDTATVDIGVVDETVEGAEEGTVETAQDDDAAIGRSSSDDFQPSQDLPTIESASLGQIRNASEILPLRGTAWLIDSIDSEVHDAAISFAWREGEGIVSWFRDECTTGEFSTLNAAQGGWIINNDDPSPNCSSPLSAIFADGAIVGFTLANQNQLIVRSQAGEFVATHFTSTSIQDDPIVVEFQ